MIELIEEKAPTPRIKVPRLTDGIKAMVVDKQKGVRMQNRTANSVRAYARSHGWVVVGRKDGPDHQVVWRVG
jgi:hypothetical protein